jgi:hypothetical protein
VKPAIFVGAASAGLAALPDCNPIQPGPIHLLRAKLELEALAHHASPFWIILLLSVGALEHAMIRQIAAPL